jgi:tyrosinase
MPRTRRDVWKLGGDWNDTILWYARAVKVMSARPFSDMTSWRYLAAMHGVAEQLWRSNGYMKPGESLPDAVAFRREDRDQCQHHTWYFLPWHRGYLRAFERIVAAAIVQLGGPVDWALPYWNYNDESNPNRLDLPPAFGSQTWPDGGTNPLFVVARYGSTGQSGGPITLDLRSVSLDDAFLEDSFVGTQIGGSPGFGGGRTPFKHSGRGDEGLLEQSPHDNVHGDIGGARDNDFMNPSKIGLMSNPSTAGLDPIFWLHHSNIDRLWESWLRAAGHVNPTGDSAWMNGPAGNRPFVMPEPDNSTRTTFFAREMLDTTGPKLDYIYEDITNPFAARERVAERLEGLGIPRAVVEAVEPAAERDMAIKPQVELLGANAQGVRLSGPEAAATVPLDQTTSRKVLESFRSGLESTTPREPDRVFLNLENIKASSDAASFSVYVGLKPDEKPEDHPENLAGVVTLFGVAEATSPENPHGDNGLNKVIEITDAIDRLHLAGVQELNQIPVRFVLRRARASDIQIGRISIYRQGK